MKSKKVGKFFMMVMMAFAIIMSGLVVTPNKVEAAVTDTVLRWPTDSRTITQYFSATNSKVHQGIDISGTLNSSIYAAESGTVVSRGYISGGYGNYLVIQHQSGLFTLYGHLNKYAANTEVDKKVTKGQVIAYMGSTGNSSGNHLHFEVRKVKTLYWDYQLSNIQKNLYNPMSFNYSYTGGTVTANNAPTGIIDSVVCDISGKIHVQGWAYDPDTKSTLYDSN